MDSQHMTQQNFADFIGVSSASLSNIFNGRQKPTLNTVEAIRTKFSKLSLDWLMYGQGPMFKDQSLMNKEQDPNLQKNEGAAATEGQLDFDPQPLPHPIINKALKLLITFPIMLQYHQIYQSK